MHYLLGSKIREASSGPTECVDFGILPVTWILKAWQCHLPWFLVKLFVYIVPFGPDLGDGDHKHVACFQPCFISTWFIFDCDAAIQWCARLSKLSLLGFGCSWSVSCGCVSPLCQVGVSIALGFLQCIKSVYSCVAKKWIYEWQCHVGRRQIFNSANPPHFSDFPSQYSSSPRIIVVSRPIVLLRGCRFEISTALGRELEELSTRFELGRVDSEPLLLWDSNQDLGS